MSTRPEAVIHLISSDRGVYIPQHFVETIDLALWGLELDSWGVKALRAGPEHPDYWDAWHVILDCAEITIGEDTYNLYQDGDVWALCYERMTPEEKKNFGFEDE